MQKREKKKGCQDFYVYILVSAYFMMQFLSLATPADGKVKARCTFCLQNNSVFSLWTWGLLGLRSGNQPSHRLAYGIHFSEHPELACVSAPGSVALCIKIEKKRKWSSDWHLQFGRMINDLIRNKLRVSNSMFYYQFCYGLAVTLSQSLNSVISPCVKYRTKWYPRPLLALKFSLYFKWKISAGRH